MLSPPKPVAVPEFAMVTPDGTLIVSPLTPKVIVDVFVLQTCNVEVPDTVSIVFVSNLLIIKLRMYSLMV